VIEYDTAGSHLSGQAPGPVLQSPPGVAYTMDGRNVSTSTHPIKDSTQSLPSWRSPLSGALEHEMLGRKITGRSH
jgi:hypothetical protein